MFKDTLELCNRFRIYLSKNSEKRPFTFWTPPPLIIFEILHFSYEKKNIYKTSTKYLLLENGFIHLLLTNFFRMLIKSPSSAFVFSCSLVSPFDVFGSSMITILFCFIPLYLKLWFHEYFIFKNLFFVNI